MGGDDEFEKALSVLATDLAAGIGRLGWRPRSLALRNVAVFTREIADGFTDVVEIDTEWIVFGSRQWPIPLRVRFGLGYEPMTALMPVVTLNPELTLVDEPGSTDHYPQENLTGPSADAVAAAVGRLIALVNDHPWEATRSFASLEGLARTFLEEEVTPPDLAAQWRPLLAAVAGDHDRARQLLNDDDAADLGDHHRDRYARFARQLRRWLDAGGPPVPPLEQTLSELPPPPPRPARLSFATARAVTRERRAARDAARAASEKLSRAELIAVLDAEYTARGLESAPSELALDAEMIELDRQPFGKARRTLRALRLLKVTGSDAIKLARHKTGPDPEWLRPPATATYTVRSGPRRWIAVHPTADPALLANIAAAAPRRLGPLILIDAWLQPEPAAPKLTVHIGETQIGLIDTDPHPELSLHLAAARFYDEFMRVPGRLTPPTRDNAFALEIELPAHANRQQDHSRPGLAKPEAEDPDTSPKVRPALSWRD